MLCLFCELVRDFPELIGYKLFAFRIGLDWLYIVAICIFKNTLAMIVISTEFSNRPTTPVPVIYIVVVELWLKHILEWTRDAYSVFDDIFSGGDTSDILMRFEPGPHCFESKHANHSARISAVLSRGPLALNVYWNLSSLQTSGRTHIYDPLLKNLEKWLLSCTTPIMFRLLVYFTFARTRSGWKWSTVAVF